MKQALSLTLLLLTIIPVLAQEQAATSGRRVKTKYDRVADTTTVQCDLIESNEAPAKLNIQANASFKGEKSNETAIFWLSLSSNRSGATRRTQPLFNEAGTLCLWIDSDQINCPVADYNKDYFELAQLFAESARAEVNREGLQKMLDAKSLHGRWGGVEFKLSDAALASLKDFISKHIF